MDIPLILSPEIQKIISENSSEYPALLSMQLNKRKDLPVKEIVNQVQGKQKARTKLPEWHDTKGIIYPSLISMEQCSSQQTAKLKSALIKGDTLVDLTAGFGVDTYYLSKNFREVSAVEINNELVEIDKHNFKTLGADNVTFHCTDSESFVTSMPGKVNCIYIDPARRLAGDKKVTLLEDYEPNIVELLPLLFKKSNTVVVKTSPLLDINQAAKTLKNIEKVVVIALHNECKEVLYFIKENVHNDRIETYNLTNNGTQEFHFTVNEEKATLVDLHLPQQYLYEPNAAILKAGAFKLLGKEFNLSKINPNSHLYTSGSLYEDFPGRIFKVKEILSYDKKALKNILPENKANITVRNFPYSVNEIRKKTGVKEGGNTYIFATTDLNEKLILIMGEKVK